MGKRRALYTIGDIEQFYSDLNGPCGNIVMGRFLSAAINTIIGRDHTVVLRNEKLREENIRISGIGFGLPRGTIISYDGVGDYAANEMSGRTMLIKGGERGRFAAGDYLARYMRGGEVVVVGNVADNAANCMKGGKVVILGEAGRSLGMDSSKEATISVSMAYNVATAHRSIAETDLANVIPRSGMEAALAKVIL